jgi:Uma2 family endonuclease
MQRAGGSRLYQEQRVQHYWAVDPDERVAEVWTPEARVPSIERERLVWAPAGARGEFSLALEELFRPI